MKKKRILLLVYMLSPYRGSEYSVAWNHILYLSKYYDLDVLYGCSGDHMGDDNDLQRYLTESDLETVNFIYIKPSKLARLLNAANKKGFFKKSFYLAYHIWHSNVYVRARSLPRLSEYDLVHYLNPIGFREPGYLWRLPLPYIWGPIGGMPPVKTCVQPSLPAGAKFGFFMRNIITLLQLTLSKRIDQAFKSADMILSVTTENREIIRQKKRIDAPYLPENGPLGEFFDEKKYYKNNKLNLIWVGSLDYRKNFQLLLDVIDACKNRSDLSVVVVGDGPLYRLYKETISHDPTYRCVTMLGAISRAEVENKFKTADLHVITSMSEGNPTTLWESMTHGVPTISLDISGMKDIITELSGFLIPHANPYEVIVGEFAGKIDMLSEDRGIIPKMKGDIRRAFDKFHWEKRVVYWQKIYDGVAKDGESKNVV